MGTSAEVFVRTTVDVATFVGHLKGILNIGFANGTRGPWPSKQWSGLGLDVDISQHSLRDVPEIIAFAEYPIEIRFALYRYTVPPDLALAMRKAAGLYVASIVSESLQVETAVTEDLEVVLGRFYPGAKKKPER